MVLSGRPSTRRSSGLYGRRSMIWSNGITVWWCNQRYSGMSVGTSISPYYRWYIGITAWWCDGWYADSLCGRSGIRYTGPTGSLYCGPSQVWSIDSSSRCEPEGQRQGQPARGCAGGWEPDRNIESRLRVTHASDVQPGSGLNQGGDIRPASACPRCSASERPAGCLVACRVHLAIRSRPQSGRVPV